MENFTEEPGMDCSYFLNEVSVNGWASEEKKAVTEIVKKIILFIAPKIKKILIE
jgi:hypothetical protein